MGMLAAAGVISGAGQGAQQGLTNVQNAFTLKMLQEERAKAEMERAQFSETMANQRLEKSEAGATTRHEQTQAGETQRHNESLAANEANVGQQITSHESMANLERESKEKIAGQQVEAENKKTTATEQHYKDWKEVYNKIASAKGETHLNPIAKQQLEFQMQKMKGIQDRISKGTPTPEEIKEADVQIEQIGQTVNRILGIAEPAAPKPAGIVDRFKSVPAAPPPSPTVPPPGMVSAAKPPTGQPGYVPGQEEFQDLVNRLKPSSTRPGGSPTVPMQP